MPKTISDRTHEQKYRFDANYYRLGYQLAAQLMHRHEVGEGKGRYFEMASDILFGERKHPDHPYRADARRWAESLRRDAEEILELFRHHRETKRWLVRRQTLSSKEKRLERFLYRTVVPCLTIVIAASLRRTHPEEAEMRIAPIQRRVELHRASADKEDDISFRALYNLACYEAGGDSKTSHGMALRYLAMALDRAPSPRRRELGKWAQTDPSLKPLQEKPGFKKLLEPYG